MIEKTDNVKYSLKELVIKTGISERNIKFWSSEFNIIPERIGRNNYYSEKLFEIFLLIKILTESKFFTQKFIKLFVDYNLNKSKDFFEFKEFIVNLKKFLTVNNKLKTVNFNIFDSQFFDKLKISEYNTYQQNVSEKKNNISNTNEPKPDYKFQNKDDYLL